MRELNKLLVLCGVLLLTIALTPSVASQTFPEYEQEFNWTIPCFAPAKVNINYLYTHNHSIRDISCLGATSLYRHSGGPENIMFEAEDLDTYKYTVELYYKEITQQHLTAGIWSGTQQVQPSYEFNFYTMHLVINVILQVTEEPQYPTAEETAEATLFQLESMLMNYTQELKDINRELRGTLQVYTAIIFITIGMAAIALVYATKMSRRR